MVIQVTVCPIPPRYERGIILTWLLFLCLFYYFLFKLHFKAPTALIIKLAPLDHGPYNWPGLLITSWTCRFHCKSSWPHPPIRLIMPPLWIPNSRIFSVSLFLMVEWWVIHHQTILSEENAPPILSWHPGLQGGLRDRIRRNVRIHIRGR